MSRLTNMYLDRWQTLILQVLRHVIADAHGVDVYFQELRFIWQQSCYYLASRIATRPRLQEHNSGAAANAQNCLVLARTGHFDASEQVPVAFFAQFRCLYPAQ